MPRLIILKGELVDRYVELDDRDLRLGRDEQNDVVLDDPEKVVSRYHAELRTEGGQYVLIDLKSQNGTWLGAERVHRIVLEPGVRLTMGAYQIQLEAPAEQSVVPTVAAQQSDAQTTSIAGLIGDTGAVSNGARYAGQQPSSQEHAAWSESGARPRGAPPPQGPALRHDRPTVSPTQRRKVLAFAAVALVAVLAIVVGWYLRSTGTSLGRGETNEARVTALLDEGRARLERGEFAEARSRFDGALLIDPSHAEATRLKAQAEEKLRELEAKKATGALTAVGQTSPVEKVPVAESASGRESGQPRRGEVLTPAGRTRAATKGEPKVPSSMVLQRPGESKEAWQQRDRRCRELYSDGIALLRSKDYVRAVRTLETLYGEEPGCGDVAARLQESKDGLREQLKETFDSALSLEKSGDLVGAAKQLDRVKGLDAAFPGLDDALGSLRAAMKASGEDLLRQARQYDALGRRPEALLMYEKALSLLPADHPSYKLAKERVDALKVGIK